MSETAQIGRGTVMSLIPGLLMKHGTIVSLGVQTQKMWAAHQDEAIKILGEYNRAVAQAQQPVELLDQAAIVLDIMALHPDVTPLIVTTLMMWQSHIVEGCAVLKEFQSAATAAVRGA